ncbi:hypothetical protein BYT27DRAFT_7130101 [Phlegmacium glaucopus]|nr:hypothetical protein BYT27DRAFT_7130101 [Phlegmacium glaucopus]
MANNPSLPLEVIGEIIDQVAAEDDRRLSSTKACALVCHSVLPLCRSHIFASVTLNARHPASNTTSELNYLLSKSPGLAVYIRKLVYYVEMRDILIRRSSSTFKKLVKLQTLSIYYLATVPGRKLDWMSPLTRKVLLPLVHLPTLTSISLFAIQNFPLADLAGCVNLKKLDIAFLECSNDVGGFLEALPTTPVMLEEFTIQRRNVDCVQRMCHARRPDGKPIIDFSSLKKIVAEVAQLDLMKELFGLCRNIREIDLSVRHVASSDPSSTSSLAGLFAMLRPSLPTLRDIRIENRIDTDQGCDDPLSGLCHELEKMASQNTVETIKVVVWIDLGCDCKRGDEWGELDNVLMRSPEDWPALKGVSLFIKVVKYHDSRMDDDNLQGALKRLLVTQFTKLVESKQVQFKFSVDGY